MLALDSRSSDMVLELSRVTLMHGHEFYYALAAAYSQIHLSSQNCIYLIICLVPQFVKKNQMEKQDLAKVFGQLWASKSVTNYGQWCYKVVECLHVLGTCLDDASFSGFQQGLGDHSDVLGLLFHCDVAVRTPLF